MMYLEQIYLLFDVTDLILNAILINECTEAEPISKFFNEKEEESC